ncbi:MAG: RDD family protein [Nocardioides sp.]|uniref:RDD family protein n=1 Tax=Nocardioides sp. TaxID=35761 RepID=UPI0039E5C1B0
MTSSHHPAGRDAIGGQQLPFETASWARRVLALLVDWLVCWLVVAFLLGWHTVTRTGSSAQWWVLGAYVVESALLTAFVGGSFGKLATRLRTVRAVPIGGYDPRPLDPLRALARQLLIAVVIPPLVFRPDGRGLHDLAAGTATVTLATYRSRFLGKR